ncbi:MAG: 16S rRNA (cytosine(967)-C(5))-methyltransferase RsmB [Moraxellaceae bacterium]|nr:16S rRNA (cytosine(967)-C(5))-methyltransferase RsmB [Moraxellaceae bacterium]
MTDRPGPRRTGASTRSGAPARSGPSTRARTAGPRVPALPPLPGDSLALQLSVAAEAVARVRVGQALNDGLASLWQAHPELPPASRSAVQDIVFGSLRDYGRAEAFLARLLRQPLTAEVVDGLLRVALYRLETRPDASHTIVDQAVEAAARMAGGNFKGLVNGVLRSALRDWKTLVAAADAQDESRWRHPAWWLRALRKHYPQDWQAIAEANNSHPAMSLRVNRRRWTLAEARAALDAAGHTSSVLGERNPWGLRLDEPMPVASLPGFAEGKVSVQDWGAQQAGLLLGVANGMRVLDACAAPGGKTSHILELADVDLLALDAEPARAQRVTQQLDRLGLSATVKAADARRPADWWDGKPFDRILADVPCSASGVVRRHPDIKWLRRSEDVARFATLQTEILEALWPTLARGGKLLYLTCSMFPDENGLQVQRFAARHPDCKRAPMPDGALERQWLPGTGHDGFYFALLEKT